MKISGTLLFFLILPGREQPVQTNLSIISYLTNKTALKKQKCLPGAACLCSARYPDRAIILKRVSKPASDKMKGQRTGSREKERAVAAYPGYNEKGPAEAGPFHQDIDLWNSFLFSEIQGSQAEDRARTCKALVGYKVDIPFFAV